MDAAELLARTGRPGGGGHPSVRLAHTIAAAVAEGRLSPGATLPAERELAGALGVSRGTVARAYERLRREELVHTRHGAGTRVGPADLAPRAAGAALWVDSIVAAVGDRDPSTIDLRVAAWDGDVEVLRALGQDGPDLPASVLGRDGYWPLGIWPLREAIAARLTATGLPTTAEQIVITNGAQQALDVVLATLTRPGDPVLVERASWPGIFELLAIRHLRGVAVGTVHLDHLPLLRALRERRADLAYLVPTFHNPTGGVLPEPARRLVVEAAAAGGGVVIDDLTMAELWMDRPPPPPLAATVPEAGAHVITVGSLSKSLWGGLRTGWLRAEGGLLRDLARVKAAVDLGNPVVSQLAAVRALAHAEPILASRRTELRHRRGALLAALSEHLPDWTVEPPAGGLSLWVDVGQDGGDRLTAAARDHGVRIPAARVCTLDGIDIGHVRLTLSRPADELERAVQRLAAAWASLPHGDRLSGATPG